MRLLTEDATTWIIAQDESGVTYENVDGDVWVIHGQCNQCGLCYVGANDPNIVWTGKTVGEPGACFDKSYETRKDIPVRPEVKEEFPPCSLSGHYVRRGTK
jgi:hypothetical protein